MAKAKAKFELLDQYLAKRDYAAALEAVTEEIKGKPGNFNLLLRQAEILGLAGDKEQAIQVYQKLAQYFARQGFYARAIAVTNKILRLDPSRKQVTNELAGMIAAQQEVERASREKMQRAAAPVRAVPAAPAPTPAPAAPVAPPVAEPPVEEEILVEVVEEPEAGAATEELEATTGPQVASQISAEQVAKERDASRFFANFPREALAELLSSTSVHNFHPNAPIVREGDSGTSFFLIEEGSVEVRTNDPAGKPVTLARLGPGEFFGEVSVLTGRPRTATIVALEPVTVIEISRADLERIVAAHPQVRDVLQRFYQQRAQATVETMLVRLRSGGG